MAVCPFRGGFGYKDTSFGINRLAGGTLPVQSLTVTTRGTTGNCTITLYDGLSTARAFTVPLTTTVLTGTQTAQQIAAFNYTTLYPGWIASCNGTVVTFVCMSAQDNKLLTYAAGATGSVVTTSSITTGVAPNGSGAGQEDEFINQTSWNIDNMDGSKSIYNPSGNLLVPSNGNVYQILIQYLGVGTITLFIENENTGKFQPVHQIRFANKYSVRNLKLPNFFYQVFSRNTTSTTSVSIKSASNFGAIQGWHKELGVTRSFNTGILALPNNANSFVLYAIKPSVSYNNTYCVVNLVPVSLTVSNDSANPIKLTLIFGNPVYLNTTSTWSTTKLTSPSTSATLLNWAETTASSPVAPTGGMEVFSIGISTGGQSVIDLKPYNLSITTFQTLCVVLSSLTSAVVGTNTYSVGLQWVEDQ